MTPTQAKARKKVRQPKPVKAWGVLTESKTLVRSVVGDVVSKVHRNRAEQYVRPGRKVVRVTITVDEP